jgi:hypothetical protein
VHVVQSHSNTCFFGICLRSTLNHTPLEYRFPIKISIRTRSPYLGSSHRSSLSDPLLMWVPNKIPHEIPGPRGGAGDRGVLPAGAILQ